MYDQVCRVLAENGTRLLYTANRAAGGVVKMLESEYASLRGETSLN